MKNFKLDITSFFITLILLLNWYFFYIIKNINENIVLLILIIFIIYNFIITKKNKYKIDKKIGKYIIFVIPICILSAFAAFKSYNQDIWLGIRPQRVQIIWWLTYYAIYRLIMNDKIKYSDFEKIIYRIAGLQIIIYFVFWLSNGHISFLNIPFDYRYGSIRLRADTMVILVLFIIVLNKILKKEKVGSNIFVLISIYIFEIICIKTRLIIIAMSLTLILLFIIWKKNIIIKIFFIPIILLGTYAFLQTNIGHDIIDSITGKTETTLSIREDAKEFYINELNKSPIIGRGYINTQYNKAVNLGEIDKGYYVVDNGIIGYIWYYGIIGLAFILIIYLNVIKMSIKLYKHKKDYLGICFCIMNLILSPNIICWWWNTTFIFLMWFIINYMRKELIENEKS